MSACATRASNKRDIIRRSGQSRVVTTCIPEQLKERTLLAMKKHVKVSILSLLAAGGLGFLLGTLVHDRQPRVALAQTATAQAPNDGKLRIIVFGAHPDDPEYRGAGVAMKWAKQGHHVKLVAATNGDVGHWEIGGRTAGTAAQEGSRGGGAAAGRGERSARHPRRRDSADPGEPRA